MEPGAGVPRPGVALRDLWWELLFSSGAGLLLVFCWSRRNCLKRSRFNLSLTMREVGRESSTLSSR